MPYVDCDNHCECGEICDGETYYECDECEQLEREIEKLKEELLSEKQEKKLEEYERLKTWLLRSGVKPSDLILELDHYVATAISNFMSYRAIYYCTATQEELDIMSSLVKQWMANL